MWPLTTWGQRWHGAEVGVNGRGEHRLWHWALGLEQAPLNKPLCSSKTLLFNNGDTSFMQRLRKLMFSTYVSYLYWSWGLHTRLSRAKLKTGRNSSFLASDWLARLLCWCVDFAWRSAPYRLQKELTAKISAVPLTNPTVNWPDFASAWWYCFELNINKTSSSVEIWLNVNVIIKVLPWTLTTVQ